MQTLILNRESTDSRFKFKLTGTRCQSAQKQNSRIELNQLLSPKLEEREANKQEKKHQNWITNSRSKSMFSKSM
jgi:hypothetical protein